MKILDSNILIYAAIDKYAHLREFIQKENPVVSAISKLEVLGYHKLGEEEYQVYYEILEKIQVIEISVTIIEQAIKFRRTKSMSLGDAIIASTAFLHGFTLVTRNTKDFSHIPTLQLFNPFES